MFKSVNFDRLFSSALQHFVLLSLNGRSVTLKLIDSRVLSQCSVQLVPSDCMPVMLMGTKSYTATVEEISKFNLSLLYYLLLKNTLSF
jgi:hypothetical protein